MFSLSSWKVVHSLHEAMKFVRSYFVEYFLFDSIHVHPHIRPPPSPFPPESNSLAKPPRVQSLNLIQSIPTPLPTNPKMSRKLYFEYHSGTLSIIGDGAGRAACISTMNLGGKAGKSNIEFSCSVINQIANRQPVE